MFGWGSSKQQAGRQAAEDESIGDLFDPAGVLRALDRLVPQYLDRVDRHELISPACTRTLADADGDVRSIWQHTRFEAMRYVVSIPGRDDGMLLDPARQPETLSAFLRQLPHENTVIDFTGVPAENLAIAIIAGLNWLSHGSVLAGVAPEKFTGTLRGFRKVVRLAEQWWETEGADSRCRQMLAERQKPPLMLYLIWSDYTRLAREIAGAAIARRIEKQRETREAGVFWKTG